MTESKLLSHPMPQAMTVTSSGKPMGSNLAANTWSQGQWEIPCAPRSLAILPLFPFEKCGLRHISGLKTPLLPTWLRLLGHAPIGLLECSNILCISGWHLDPFLQDRVKALEIAGHESRLKMSLFVVVVVHQLAILSIDSIETVCEHPSH